MIPIQTNKHLLYILLLILCFTEMKAQWTSLSVADDNKWVVLKQEFPLLHIAEDEILGHIPFSVKLPNKPSMKILDGNWRSLTSGTYVTYNEGQLIFIEDKYFSLNIKYDWYFKNDSSAKIIKGYILNKNDIISTCFKFQDWNAVMTVYDDNAPIFKDEKDNIFNDKKLKPSKDRISAYFVKDNIMVYLYNIKKNNFFNWFETIFNSFHIIPFDESKIKTIIEERNHNNN